MLIEKCKHCNVDPSVKLDDGNKKLFCCDKCGCNAKSEYVKNAKEAAKKWNDANG